MKWFLNILLMIVSAYGFAYEVLKPLPADQAFQFSMEAQKDQMILHWKIAPDYFLYRDKITLKLAPSSQANLGKVILPVGHLNKALGDYQVYVDKLTIPVPFNAASPGKIMLEVNYQGCSAKGFCYPPIKQELQIDITAQMVSPAPEFSGQSYAKQLLDTKNNVVRILIFLGLGLLLAFTPCVLPMVPILSSIILGHKHQLTTLKAFLLSLSYVLGMAFTYAIAGMVVALLGESVQAFMQKTWVIILFSVLFFLLALALLDFYQMHLPAHWQQRLHRLSSRQKSGSYIGVFLMGSLSTLVVSPCVSAPLVGVLAYIAQTGDVWLGAGALLALGFGMGLPLLLIGTSAGKLLPKSGAWMQYVQKGVGVFMLAVAIWMLSRVIAPSVTLFLWGMLLVYVAILIKRWLDVGLISFICGTILMIGALMGNSDPLHPWENWNQVKPVSAFIVVKDMDQLNQSLQQKKFVLIDFYADWCSACVLMDKKIFHKADVQKLLKNTVLLRIDVTQQNAFDRAVMKRFGVIAPPTILFFHDGKELKDKRIVGEVTQEEFQKHVMSLPLFK